MIQGNTRVGRVKITDHIAKFAQQNAHAMDMALNHAAVDIIRLSKAQVPKDTGNLQSSGKLERKGLMRFEVNYNAQGNAPYARRWEYNTPSGGFQKGRKSHYLSDPGNEITSGANMIRLFKAAANTLGTKI